MRLQTLSNLFRIFLWDSRRPCVSVRSIKSKSWWNSRCNAAIQLTNTPWWERVQERNLPLCQWGSAEKLKSPQSKLSIEKTTSTLLQITQPGKWCFVRTHTLCILCVVQLYIINNKIKIIMLQKKHYILLASTNRIANKIAWKLFFLSISPCCWLNKQIVPPQINAIDCSDILFLVVFAFQADKSILH